jgi:hypothetical protein
MRPEGVLRPELEEEPLELVDPVERRHRTGERAGGGAEDPADPRPQRGLAEPLEEAQLEEDAVDPAAREHKRNVPFHAHPLSG